MVRLVFLGPPGAGKGTQATILAERLHLPHLSTGDMLRAAVAARTPVGLEAQGHMDAGRLVPDAVVLGVLRDRLAAPDCREGFVLDGFPRNVAQATELGRFARLDAVIAFELPFGDLVDRLSGRRVCPVCQSVYNVTSRPPQVPGRCDREGHELVQRPDDQPEAVRTRLKVYAEQTAPLLVYYREQRLLRTLDAGGRPEDVSARLRALLP